MKFYFLLALIIFAFLYGGCRKKDNAVAALPANGASAGDSIYNATSVLPVANYTGRMVAKGTYGCTVDAPPPDEDSDAAFVFYVTNIKNDILVFTTQNPIALAGYGYIPINDTFTKTTQNVYSISYYEYSVTFKIVNDMLYVTGNMSNDRLNYDDYCGSATITFTGKLQPFDTIAAQGQH